MAISRREALKCGISYGTGVINHGNDCIAYDRELRKFPQDTSYADLREALGAGDVETALSAARAYRQLCGTLAMSGVCMLMANVVDALEEGSLPPAEDLAQLDEAHCAIVDYLSRS